MSGVRVIEERGSHLLVASDVGYAVDIELLEFDLKHSVDQGRPSRGQALASVAIYDLERTTGWCSG